MCLSHLKSNDKSHVTYSVTQVASLVERRARGFPAVFETKLQIPWRVQCGNIWLTCSQEPL